MNKIKLELLDNKLSEEGAEKLGYGNLNRAIFKLAHEYNLTDGSLYPWYKKFDGYIVFNNIVNDIPVDLIKKLEESHV
jgi:hypothetical protein